MHPHKFKNKLHKLDKISESLPSYAYDLFVAEANGHYSEVDDTAYQFRVRLTLAMLANNHIATEDKAVIGLALCDYGLIVDSLKTVENFDSQKYAQSNSSYKFESSIISSMIGLYVIEKFIKPYEINSDYVPMFSNTQLKHIKSNIVKICELVKKHKRLDLIGMFDNFSDFADTICISAISEVLGERK